MKFILSLAAIAAMTSAIQIDSKAEAVATTELAQTEAKAAAADGYSGPIVPEKYGQAVHEFNLESPFTD